MESDPLTDRRFVGYRRALIERIRMRGIDDLAILQLFDRVPRHGFVPEAMWSRAYEDSPVPIGFGQTASQPSLQALTLELLEPQETDTVLEIGTGSGFLTALLALVTGRVYSVERIRELSIRARKALDAVGVQNAALLVGDGTIGWKKYAPFDIVVVSAASPAVPQPLIEQLAEGGRMLVPVGDLSEQTLVLVRRKGGQILQEPLRDRVKFVPLLGRFGWTNDQGEDVRE